MDYVISNNEPQKIEYHKLSDGRAFVLLHKDIEQYNATYEMSGETMAQKMWRCHEKQFMTTLTEAEVESQFDSLYLTVGSPGPTTKEVLDTLSDAVDALSRRVDELEGSK